MPHQVALYWRSNNVEGSGVRSFELSDNQQKLQELITAKCWRIDNLTPGLDLIDDFWNLALQESNYELIREKLYFKLMV